MDSEIEPILQETTVINRTDLLNKPKNKNKESTITLCALCITNTNHLVP